MKGQGSNGPRVQGSKFTLALVSVGWLIRGCVLDGSLGGWLIAVVWLADVGCSVARFLDCLVAVDWRWSVLLGVGLVECMVG